MHVPSGIPYQVGAYGPIHWDMMQPTMQVITPTANSVISLTLQFKEKGGTILGTAYYLEQGTKTLAPESLVWAWSKDGHHTSTRTDSTGDFTLNVVTGTTWYIGANYNPENSAIYYETITHYSGSGEQVEASRVNMNASLFQIGLKFFFKKQ